MYKNNIFKESVNNILGMATPQFCNKILGFKNYFSVFLVVTDQEVDSFVKKINSYNSARPPNGKILIPFNIPQSSKSVIFELKDREMCGALPNGLIIIDESDRRNVVIYTVSYLPYLYYCDIASILSCCY